MKKIFLFCGFLFFISVSAQEKKKDSVIYEYKARIFYPADCSCPGTIIYKELRPGDTNFNPFHYQNQKPIKVDSLYHKKNKPKDFFKKNVAAL